MASDRRARILTVYTRRACTLCDHLVLALELMQPRCDFAYEKIDVDLNPDLAERYGLRVPVLVEGQVEVCSGHCDPALIETYLRGD
ncbi:MAG: glutaredoxin family protein [Proteobacteria bacterium]|nr:glutaredoxin family protein [Pseudomonadota bacterium]